MDIERNMRIEDENWEHMLDNLPMIVSTMDHPIVEYSIPTFGSPEMTISGGVNFSGIVKIDDLEKIVDITRINDIVTQVTFGDGTVEKMVLSPEDEFDLEKCLYIAIAKKLYRRELTQKGIEHKAEELSYEKRYAKIVRDALKAYDTKIKNEKIEKKRIEDEKARIARKRAKKIAYKERREARKREERIDEQSEAYLRAMRIMKGDTED